MGFHICEWCDKENMLKAAHIASPSSSMDITLKFASGRTWQFPHTGLMHYVTSHHYQPPEDFVLDVMTSEVVGSESMQTKSVSFPVKVGYLQYPDCPTGYVPGDFVERLSGLIWNANKPWRDMDSRLNQTRGVR